MSATQLALKRCSKCGDTKPLDQFHNDKKRKDGKHPHCKACVNTRVALYFKSNQGKAAKKRYNQTSKGKKAQLQGYANYMAKDENRVKRRAHQAVARAIRRSEMAPASACQCNDCCKAPAVELHHHSYEPIHWLDVVPLCKACHIYRHANPESF